jgi:hypothetical protein
MITSLRVPVYDFIPSAQMEKQTMQKVLFYIKLLHLIDLATHSSVKNCDKSASLL